MDDGRDRVADDKRETVEIRFHAPAEHVGVLDAIGISKGLDRTAVMKQLLADLVEKEIHRATLVLRVARINPLAREEQGRDGK